MAFQRFPDVFPILWFSIGNPLVFHSFLWFSIISICYHMVGLAFRVPICSFPLFPPAFRMVYRLFPKGFPIILFLNGNPLWLSIIIFGFYHFRMLSNGGSSFSCPHLFFLLLWGSLLLFLWLFGYPQRFPETMRRDIKREKTNLWSNHTTWYKLASRMAPKCYQHHQASM